MHTAITECSRGWRRGSKRSKSAPYSVQDKNDLPALDFYGTFLAALVPLPTGNNHLIFQQKTLRMAVVKATMDIKMKDIMQDTSEI